MSTFPRKLADLKVEDDALFVQQTFYGSLKELRKATLSIPNRLCSILTDAAFVQKVSPAFDLPLIANERCGSWYVPPKEKAGSVYFKSTDGHSGQWSFSLRRLNLQVLEIIGQHGGCVIVDSTRRGKLIPDALSKTVPIWCAVMNRALFPESRRLHKLQHSGMDLTDSEIAQIEARLDGFVRNFCGLGIEMEELRRKLGRPMRLQWVAGHSTQVLPGASTNMEDISCHTVVLCSASRRVEGAELSEGGYIQGAGDDSEAWSEGLTPQVFWEQKHRLLQEAEHGLPRLINQLLLEEEEQVRIPQTAVLIKPTSNLYISPCIGDKDSTDFELIVHCHGPEAAVTKDHKKHLFLNCPLKKLGSRDLRYKLHLVEAKAATILKLPSASQILITCGDGKDLAAGVALMLLCLFYSDDGKCVYGYRRSGIGTETDSSSNCDGTQIRRRVDKSFIRQRLAWISTSNPDVNPSRSTLQSVNAYLMERP